MQNRYSFLLVFPVLFSAAVLYLLLSDELEPSARAINAEIGDESYVQIYGSLPGEDVPFTVRMRTHLEYAESVLRNRPVDHLTEEQKKNRQLILTHLENFLMSEKFSQIDETNDKICVICYLVEKTSDSTLTEIDPNQINNSTFSELNHPGLSDWAEESGITIDELALIQPVFPATD
jgi:hypothetical protein